MPSTIAVRAGLRRELDGLVEQRDERVEALDRELLLAEERALEIALEDLDLGEPLEQAALLLCGERLPVAARLDRLPQPDALLVVGDVLDLVGDRPAVGLAQRGQGVRERLARDVQAQVPRRDPRLELRRERRLEALWLERGVADRLRAEGVELRGEVAVHAVRLDERHGCGDAAEEHVVRGLGRSRRRGRWLRVSAEAPFPSVWRVSRSFTSPGWVATSSLSPLSNRLLHSDGTASGFSRYSSRSARA